LIHTIRAASADSRAASRAFTWESVGLPANEAEAGSSKDFDYKRLHQLLARGDSQFNQWHGAVGRNLSGRVQALTV